MVFRNLAIATLSLSPVAAMAHPGHESTAFSSGLLHPITGLDHLIMLVAFGLLLGCLRLSMKAKASLIGGALAMLVVGVMSGHQFGLVSGVELAIVSSLFVVSAALWQAFSASQTMMKAAVSLCIGLVFFHGYAHGVEAQGTVAQFTLGMAISATALMALGVKLGELAASRWLSVGVAAVSSALVLVV
nr:HupE/UreJ family protein [Vibrio hippocampi]